MACLKHSGDALSRLYQDYYNLVVRNDQAFVALDSSDKKGKRGHIQTARTCWTVIHSPQVSPPIYAPT